jgi:chloramphenicol 3-O-phosphotransferase
MSKNEKGAILLLNSIMHSGKTSIAKEILRISDENYYYIAIDTFIK